MDKEKISWAEAMDRLDKFEDSFKNDPGDPALENFFENLGNSVLISNFDRKQISKLLERMGNLKELFAGKKQEVRSMSCAALQKRDQLHRYLKNANYKNLVK